MNFTAYLTYIQTYTYIRVKQLISICSLMPKEKHIHVSLWALGLSIAKKKQDAPNKYKYKT